MTIAQCFLRLRRPHLHKLKRCGRRDLPDGHKERLAYAPALCGFGTTLTSFASTSLQNASHFVASEERSLSVASALPLKPDARNK